MTQWEYKADHLPYPGDMPPSSEWRALYVLWLDNFGRDGWELIHIDFTGPGILGLFKRPR